MTTPIDIPMPYGVTVEGTGFANPAIVGNHPMKDTNVALRLTPGPCRIAASWEGDEQVFVRVQNRGKSIDRTIATIRGGGGGARSVMVTVGAVAGDSVYLAGARATGITGTIEVYPLAT